MRNGAFVLGLSCLVVGCASVETTNARQDAEGIRYNLPKGKFEIIVVDNGGAISAHLAGLT